MIEFPINNVPTLFAQAFSRDDVDTIVNYVLKADSLCQTKKETVLFIDTPASPLLVDAINHLKTDGFRVVYRDHHGVSGEPTNVRDIQKQKSCRKLEELLGNDCLITFREYHPACSSLVEVGEFEDALAIVADPDADGLTAAMKAAGVFYEGLDEDAALLDSEPALQVTGSEISQLLAKGIATLPSYTSERPKEREETLKKLFLNWTKAVQGDKRALEQLEPVSKQYDEAVKVAQELVVNAIKVAPGVSLIDVTDTPLFDVGTLNKMLEKDPKCQITVLRKDRGPIAQEHGIQLSLSVTKAFQNLIDLRSLVPAGISSDPANGVISNVSFLLHVSEGIWDEHVYPAIQKDLI